jgi:DNA (cytosine-5)-methyltransferase 1
MIFGSVCSGIEAASVAFSPLGWKAAFFSEIEKFPNQVLKHHYPDVPNHGDMTKFQEWKVHETIRLLCGGTPCQSFSIAGLRKGLDDSRGNLMLTFGEMAAKFRPAWFKWENVPGVLSSGGGRDFAAFLGLLSGRRISVPRGGWGKGGIIPGYKNAYGLAYRMFDAQYFGVAQRRRRVFVVGYIGDWRPAAAVLFERESVRGYPAPRRKAREKTAGGAGEGFKSGSHWDGDLAHPSLSQSAQSSGGIGYSNQEIFSQRGAGLVPSSWPAEVAPTLDAHYGDKMGLENQHINAGGGGAVRCRRWQCASTPAHKADRMRKAKR